MSYTAPAGDAVAFEFDGTSYTAPAGDALAFEFLAIPTRTLDLVGQIAVGGQAAINHGVAFSAEGAIALGGTAAFNRGVDFQSITGVVTVGGTANLLADPSLFVFGRIALSGNVAISAGRSVNVAGSVKVSGAIHLNAGRTLSAHGSIKLGACSAQFRHGRRITVLGKIGLSGVAELSALPAYTLTCFGVIALNGTVVLDVKRDAPLPSTSVFLAQSRAEVFTHGV